MNPQSGRPVSRRSIAKGAAWAVPVIAFAEAAPAASASTRAVCSVTVTGAGVKAVHGKIVTLSFTVQNSGAAPETVSFVSISGPANTTWSAPTPANWQAAPGQSSQDVALTRSNNANGTATVTLLVCGQNMPLSVQIGR